MKWVKGELRMVLKTLSEQHLKAICDVLADTNKGLTKSEITNLLKQCKVELVDDGHSSNGYIYTVGLSKSKWLYNCFVKEINSKQSFENIYLFVVKAMDP